MKQKLSPVTLHYTLITGGFWMAFCVVTAYAAVYLQGVGCTNAELGLILALGNVGGAILSPVLGAQIDRNRNLRQSLNRNHSRNPNQNLRRNPNRKRRKAKTRNRR